MSHRLQFRRRRIVLLAGAAIGAVMSLAVLRWYLRMARPAPQPGQSESRLLVLPFTIPCAQQSADAQVVYHDLRSRNRSALEQLFAAHRLLVVHKGAHLRVSPFGTVAMLSIETDRDSAEVCFVPGEWIPVLNRSTANGRSNAPLPDPAVE